MSRSTKKLTAAKVKNTTQPGMYSDGEGLYLQVSKTSTKSWVLRYKRHGKAREMGLGALITVSLSDARIKALHYRKMLLEGEDPIFVRDQEKLAKRLEETAGAKSFKDCAKEYITAHKASWNNEKHINQWENTLSSYAEPKFGSKPVEQVDTTLVMKCLEPIWYNKTETANRVRGRIESILDWAKVKGYRSGENPARWKGHLDQLLPAPSKVKKVKHHSAMPYKDIGDFISLLQKQESISARSLEFTILTACRTQEVLGAKWDELDLEDRIWTIPSDRMKMKREHQVPLTDRMLKIIKAMEMFKEKENDYIFPGSKEDKPQSNMTMLNLLKRVKRTDITVHGFRSTFRDWVAENTTFPGEVAEMALAHKIMNDVEAAYRRGNLLDKRRELMSDWDDYCNGKNSTAQKG